ncbi:YbfB/YjiJ family MFS transporter [Gallaecimonas xiamenensis]|uniref:Putative transporter-like membrane protein n=1 Tax=Gallaecimonas xiamenensis 3-C-1 TaxID=745411 RepID=K2JKL0_9GAMM|nr:YbfB/YjiJ family MFS transporter [Gallaecimonas xiamenensis]EKE74987.1 putative transporter-like membrane protein [Gallaecimonas xiamenensis 3-C-1]
MTTADNTGHPGNNDSQRIPWAAILAGFCASLIGIGLARFAYTPLIPPLISAGWFSADKVIYLGAANLAGYLIGALLARPLGRRFGNVPVLKVMMLLTAIAFFACGFPLSISWFFGWRLLSGVTGGVIMVLVAATLLPHIPASRRGLASGAIFLGLGVGIAGSGTLVPLLLSWGLKATWLGLGAIGLLLTALSWRGWPRHHQAQPAITGRSAEHSGFALKVFYLQYGLMAAALVPTMVFMVDYVARGLGQGAHVGALFWVLYGLGAIAGPVLYGQLGDKLGASGALRLLVTVQALAVMLLLASSNLVSTAIATVLIGTFPPGMVPLALHKVHQLLPGDHQAQAATWSRATVVFASFQALAGYGYSYLFTQSGGSYPLLFALAVLALVLILLGDGLLVLKAGRKGPAAEQA